MNTMSYLLYAALIFYFLSLFSGAFSRLTVKKTSGGFSKAAVIAGIIFHTFSLAMRMYLTGHAPMASVYETLIFYSWATVLVSVIVILRYNERVTGLITVPVAMIALVFAFFNEAPIGPLNIILRTRWFEAHVIASFAAYALFTLAFSAAAVYLYYDFTAKGDSELKKFQDIANRSVLWGFLFFSASMFSGAVWGYLAWGAYWLWEPKVIWSFIVWFYYAGAMHAYYVSEWKGRGLSIATVIGFFVVLFTYLGVGLLMKSSHNF